MWSGLGIRRAALLALVVAGAACGAALPVVTPNDAARTGVELTELQRGRSLVAAKCGGCHRTPVPDEHGARDWPRMLDEMAARSNLNTGQRETMLRYLVAMTTH